MNPNLKYIAILIFLSGLWQGCQSEYDLELNKWKKERLSDIKSPYGWASVVGLYQMLDTVTYFGQNENNDFIFAPTVYSSFGTLEKTDTGFYLNANESSSIQVNEKSVTHTRMLSDREKGGPTIASHHSIQWYFIERQDKAYLRVKDSLSIYRKKLSVIPYFESDKQWNIPAQFIAAESDSVVYDNALDMTFKDPIAGYLDFEINGKKQRLTALENDGSSYFVIFADITTGQTTYGGGRYLYPLKANLEGWTYLDFNKAQNPPCVFTPYATCPLPPKENYLDSEIVAGEKSMKLY